MPAHHGCHRAVNENATATEHATGRQRLLLLLILWQQIVDGLGDGVRQAGGVVSVVVHHEVGLRHSLPCDAAENLRILPFEVVYEEWLLLWPARRPLFYF